jgi:hypothetical protein
MSVIVLTSVHFVPSLDNFATLYTSVYIHRATLMFGSPCICSIDAHYSHVVIYVFIAFIIRHSISFDWAKNMRAAVVKQE